MGGEGIHALSGVDLVVNRDEYVAIMGASGSGKSPLMNLIGGLDTPDDGEYWLNGKPFSNSSKARAAVPQAVPAALQWPTWRGTQRQEESMEIKRFRFDRAVLVVLLWAGLACAASAQTLNIASGPEAVSPLRAGDRAPMFTVHDVNGNAVRFDPAHLDSPVLLITFRGGWCPYCNAQLAGLRRILPDIRSGGVEVLFLSGDRPELLFSSLQQDTQDSIDGLDYRILSDANMEAASALGIAYRVAEGTHEAYEARGRDMDDSSIALHTALPLPSVFMIDSDGKITFAYSNPDIRVRLPEDQVLAAAQPYMH